MNSITNCKEGVELAAFRARMSTALQKQKDEGQRAVNREGTPVDELRNERVKSAIQNARRHLLDLFMLHFHKEELRQIENMFIDLDLKRMAELEPGLSKTS